MLVCIITSRSFLTSVPLPMGLTRRVRESSCPSLLARPTAQSKATARSQVSQMGVFLIMHHGTILMILNGLNHLVEARRFLASCIVITSKGNTIFPWSPGHWLKWRLLHSAQLQTAIGLGGEMWFKAWGYPSGLYLQSREKLIPTKSTPMCVPGCPWSLP